MKTQALLPKLLLSFLLALLAGSAWSMNDDSELLPEDEAFAFSAQLMPDNSIEVRWDIADGYYMYRDKMGFEVTGDNALVDAVVLPAGKPKYDALFGDVDVYIDEFVTHNGYITLFPFLLGNIPVNGDDRLVQSLMNTLNLMLNE